jgi:signal transduction histidine kinase/ActR/RegA family two-component response regulator
MSIDVHQIRAQSHNEIGLLLIRNAGALVERWCDHAEVEIPDARHVHRETLRDQLPRFIAAMGQTLVDDVDATQPAYFQPALEHGEQRWNSNWSLSALVRDYQLLQLVILEYLEEWLDRPLDCREVMAVSVYVHDAIAASITTYVETRDAYIHKLDKERLQALQQMNRRKDEFIAVLAHELRNSLAPIVSSIDLLQLMLKDVDPTVREAVQILGRHARQLTCLVDDLLDLARIAQGRFELRTSHLDLASIVKQATQTSEHLFDSRQQSLQVQLPPEPLYVHADPARLIQIIVNLLNNASKYTDPGGEVWLTAEQIENEAVVKVRDTGVGIPPEMIARVFDMFVQVDESKHYGNGGLGIGLTLVQKLTELHGGTVTCHSSGLGRGSEFTVRLKVSTQPLENPTSPEPLQEQGAKNCCRVMIIEDQADARSTLAALLKAIGHSVEVAENAAMGIERSLAYQPQVALIDIGLPDSNGYEVAKKLRSEFAQRVYLVALTGYGQEEDLRAALDAGFDAHLVKPADVRALTELLSRVATASQPVAL